jgi:GTP-binding protein EngB required for normal cell division
VSGAPGSMTEQVEGDSLAQSLDRLHSAHRLGADRVPAAQLENLSAVLERAGDRRLLSAAHTVVGVFGPTGSGKSSLVNALSGTDAARVAARRPTTSEPLALVWGQEGSAELLDWLEVSRRVELPDGAALGRPIAAERLPANSGSAPDTDRRTGRRTAARVPDEVPASDEVSPGGPDDGTPDAGSPRWYRRILGRPRAAGTSRQPARRRWMRPGRRTLAPAAAPNIGMTGAPSRTAGPAAGLILLDLPDFDSTTAAHRETVERLTGQVDVLLWVVDPQKYADAALHHGFLAPLATHESVTLVALNQADRLTHQELDDVRGSLARILADEGLPGVVVLPVSARTGEGVPELAAAISSIAEGRAAATRRLAADAVRAATELLPFVPADPVAVPSAGARAALAEELGAAAGVPMVVDAVRGSYRRDAQRVMGWPVTRWLGALRPDPLRRLNLRRADLAPVAQPAQGARVLHALRVFGDAAAGDVAEPWNSSIRDAARTTSGELTDALDTAVTGTDLETGRRGWWTIIASLQWVAFAALVGGLAWLGVLAVLGFLQLPVVEVPRVEGFPLPTLLILSGALAGILLGVVGALLARWGAARRAARVRRRLLASCARVAEDVVGRAIEDEVARCNSFRTAVLAVLPGA